MNLKKMNYLPLIILPIILLVCFGLWQVKEMGTPVEAVDSETGTFDMRDIDFNNTLASVTRTVEYVPGVLLTPEEFDIRDDIQVGRVPDGARPYTMRIRVLVPDNMSYGIDGYSVNYASSVYVNGQWLFDEGKPAMTREDEKSSEAYRLFSVQPQDGVIEILIQTSSFSNVDSSSGMNWRLGKFEVLRSIDTRRVGVEIMVMGFYLITALISLLLFFALPGYTANGWLTLLSLVWSVRTGLKGVKILLTLFPFFEWPVVYKTEILTSPVTIILFVLILHSAFPNVFPKWLRRSLMGVAGAGILAVFILPWYRFFGHSSITNMVIYLTLAILLPFILFSLRRNRITVPQIIILLGVGMSIFAFAWDADYFKHGDLPYALGQPTMLAFTLFMLTATILSTMEKTVAQEVLLTQTVENQKRELTETRISIMLSQIQPHFLYNVLASIAALCKTAPLQAEKTILDFAEFLRGNMDGLTENKLMLFEKELNHVEVYLNLEKMRFGDKLMIVYDIQAVEFCLPALSLQPIVENAVKYGVGQKDGGGTVTIQSRETEEKYLILVSDDGIGFDPNVTPEDGRSHVGIKSVSQRLKAQCGGNLLVSSEIGRGTTVTIEIPKK